VKYIDIDLHKKQSQMCLLTDAGELVHTYMPTERSQFIAGVRGTDRAPRASSRQLQKSQGAHNGRAAGTASGFTLRLSTREAG
jgi:hypothetical protein